MDQKKLDAAAAAKLYSEGKSQEDIGTLLGLSQSVVSRRLKDARDEGWLVKARPTFHEERLSSEDISAIKARLHTPDRMLRLLQAVREGGSQIHPDVRVFPGADIDDFAKFSAEHVRGLLVKANVCGVSWGRSLATVVAHIRRRGSGAVRKEEPIQFVPLCGEPLGRSSRPNPTP